MLKNSFFKTIPFLLFIVLLNSCDKEFSVIGEDLISDGSFDIQKEEYSVVAYNEKIEAVQSNNLATNQFGIYNNPSFGTTTATFVTQLTMASPNPTFDVATAKIKSVVLSVPYFYTKTDSKLNSDGSTTYALDSIYGTDKAKMKLSVYESGYFMRDLDPEEQLTQPQKYYNDQYAEFYQQIKPLATAPYYLNDDSNTTQNTEFFFDGTDHAVETINTDGSKTTTRTPPAMQLNLNKDFFTTKLFGPLGAPAGSLADNTKFKDYFRGLFFNIESIGGDGNLALINFRAGTITITYTDASSTDEKKFVLNLTGNTVNLLTQSNTNADYTDATKPASDTDKAKGVPNLYLKGGEGSMAILKLFGEDNFGADGVSGTKNEIADQLDILRTNHYLINEADLTVYLNSAAMETVLKTSYYTPRRVYLYDYTNHQVLTDYTETSVVGSDSKYNKYIFGGILGKDANGASFYKFRITHHIRNLVKDLTAKNVELGLVVTENINEYAFNALKNKTGTPLYFPVASVMNPLGAIVFGNNILSTDANYAKRLKFEIYYTKPN